MFKPSASTNKVWNLVKTIAQTMVFWLIFLFLLPMGLVALQEWLGIVSFTPLKVLGWSLFVLFSLLGLFSGYTMSYFGTGTPLPLDCPNELVIRGPYKYVRNPMAVAGIGQGICVGLIMGSLVVVAYAVSGAFLWHLFVRPLEESDLQERFGQAYVDYKSRISCWVPGLHWL